MSSTFLLKTVGRLKDEYILDGSPSRKPHSENQYLYQTGRSTETVLSKAVSLLEAQMEASGFGMETCLDIESVFNNTLGATM